MESTASTGPAATAGPASPEPAGAVATGDESPAAVPAQLVKSAPGSEQGSEQGTEQGTEQAPAADDATPAFTFQVQQEFHEVPLGLREAAGAAGSGDPAEALAARDEQMNGFVRDYWGEHEELEPARRLTKALYSATGEDLIADGTVYQALGFFPIDDSPVVPAEDAPSSLSGITATASPASEAPAADGTDAGEDVATGPRVSRATLTVSVREIGNPAPNITAAGIAETLDKSDDGGEVLFVTLPAGPAVVHVAGTRAVWEREEGDQERFFVRIEVWMPFPDVDRLLLLCLSTPDAQDLFHYQEVLADIAGTVRFGEEQPVSALAADADGSPFGTY